MNLAEPTPADRWEATCRTIDRAFEVWMAAAFTKLREQRKQQPTANGQTGGTAAKDSPES